MRICLVSDTLVGYHNNWSGAELVCSRLSEELKRRGKKIISLTTRFDRKDKKDRIEEIFQIPTNRIKSGIFKKIIAPFYYLLGAFFTMYVFLKTKPDVIHFFHSNELFISVMTAAKILKIPTVLTVVDYFICCPRYTFLLPNNEICQINEGFGCLKNCINTFRFLERRVIRLLTKYLDVIITFTQTSKDRLIKHKFSPGKIRVIYNYTLPKEVIFSDGKKLPNTILFVGSLYEHKGLEIIIQAMPTVVLEVPQVKLIIAGQGREDYKKKIEKMIEAFKIKENIEFLGQKSNEEILQLISKSEVMVVPEQWLSDFGPIILIEAMALGKPIVASRIGAIPEFIEDGINGFLVERNNSGQFAQKIIWLLKNKESASLIGKKAKERVRFLYNSDPVGKTLKVYKDLTEMIR